MDTFTRNRTSDQRVTSPLRRLAEASGIQTSFTDAAGRRRTASADTLRALLRVLGVSAATDAQACEALDQLHYCRHERCIEPVIVQWDRKPMRVRLPFAASRAHVNVSELRGSIPVRVVESPFFRSSATQSWISLPPLGFGYYRLEAEFDGRRCEALIISAPTKAWSPKAMREWGAFLPMYAARDGASWGSGTFTQWANLSARIAQLGGGVVGTLPLMPAFLDEWKCEPSPYSPVSRLFWNEFFIDPTAAPEFGASSAARKIAGTTAFQRDAAALQRSAVVEYRREMDLKRPVLEAMADTLFKRDSARRQAFEMFVKARPELERYAAFRAACERQKRSWHQWPERMRGGALAAGDYSRTAFQYYLYAQWIAQEQIDSLLGRPSSYDATVPSALDPLEIPKSSPTNTPRARLYLDLPLGVNPDGYDVWRDPDTFARGASAGAPPDAFFTKGQDWGFPPMHPERLRTSGYRYVIDYLRFQMRHTGLLRLDHVMGLHRLWWVPQGASAAEGAYVRYHPEELYAILCLESSRHETLLVGENLGTVPPEVNRSMKRHALRTMYVVQYEGQPDPKAALREPQRESVASVNTHDMPTWAAHWHGSDIADRRDLGLLKACDVPAEAKRRASFRSALEQFLKRKKLLTGKANERSVLAAVLKFLADSPAELVLVNLEDLWLETAPQNTPGTTEERVNWRRKTPRNILELLDDPKVLELLKAVSRKRGNES